MEMDSGCERDLPEPFSREELRNLIVSRVGEVKVPASFRVITDTSDFMHVDFGDVAVLAGRPYLIRNNEREGRFGLDDEPKYWVKRSIDLISGGTKVIKLGFLEEFQSQVGPMTFNFFRSPRKEAAVLDLVRGDSRFMQGFSVHDEAGNTVRIIDYIVGKALSDRVLTLGSDHEEYFFCHFPAIYRSFIDLVEAIRFLHEHGEKHGDIRRDHILVEKESGQWRWIDFDFTFHYAPNPYRYDLFGLGNVLIFLAGRGDVTRHDLRVSGSSLLPTISEEDMNVVFRNRVVNLRKVYPCIPPGLNRIMMHFSAGAGYYYETADELLEDLYDVRDEIEEASLAGDSPVEGGEEGHERGNGT
jgi:hypothetical protein